MANLQRTDIAGVTVLRLNGSLSQTELADVEKSFHDATHQQGAAIVLDLSNVSKVDSGGVGKIVNCLSRLRIAGGTLCLAGVTGMIGGVLKMTQVDRLVKVYSTAQEAAQSFPHA